MIELLVECYEFDREEVVEFYEEFVNGSVIPTSAKTAEMCKLTENSFRDVNIAFANELSLICEREGINVWELIRLANRHPRVNVLSLELELADIVLLSTHGL